MKIQEREKVLTGSVRVPFILGYWEQGSKITKRKIVNMAKYHFIPGIGQDEFL